MKIALVRCPCINPDYPPDIGLGYLSAYLSRDGHEVEIVDGNIELFHSADELMKAKWRSKDTEPWESALLWSTGNELDNYINKIAAISPQVVGFSVWESNRDCSVYVATALKKSNPGIVVVFGGPECYPLLSGKRLIKEDCVDLIVYGEGEVTFREVLRSIEKDGVPRDVAGTIVKRPGSALVLERGKVENNLDGLPFPDFSKFPLDLYPNKQRLFISPNRGCINRCAYCDVPGTLPRFRFRTGESLFKEMQSQMDQFPQVTQFEFASSAINGNSAEIVKLCDLLLAHELKVGWCGNAVFNGGLTNGVLQKMREGGCYSLTFGLETASQNVLDKMGKRFSVADAERIMRESHAQGIGVVVNFIIGFPGESDDDFLKTCRFVERNRKFIDHVGSRSLCWVSPYSHMFENPEKYGVLLPVTNYDPRCTREWNDATVKDNTYENRVVRGRAFSRLIDSLGFEKDYNRK